MNCKKNLFLTKENHNEQRYNFVQNVSIVRVVRGLIILILFFINYDIFSQTINLEQARELALANSRSLANYEIAINNSILNERSQLFSMLPQLSTDYSASARFLQNWEFVNPIENYSVGANFSITQIIFQGGRSFIQKAISEISTERVRVNARAAYFNVLNEIDNAYYAVLRAAAALEANEVSLQTAVLGLSIAEIRYSSGMLNQGEYMEALAAKEVSENTYNLSRRNLILYMNRFKTLTGIKENIELEQIAFKNYEEVILSLAGVTDENADKLFEKFWEILIISNPSLVNAALSRQIAEKNFSLSKREYAPTISATLFSTNMSFLPSYNASSSGGVTIRGTIPVDFWVLSNKMKKNEISYQESLLDYENNEIEMEQNLQTALFDLFSQAGSVISSRRSLEYRQRIYEYTMERYRLLQASIYDLNEATKNLIESRNNLNNASYNFLQRLSALRSLCALDDEEKLLELLLQ